ncbi:hypothetical protein GWK91_05345 [Virgibacillus sp. MSP4-1]|uniref:hypothetical protein n=1 Tax=Virgibacillus sp. MSP4-1 TaxID=2700081 RepID=UPI0005C66B3C|nr:hypothetical protein [Virgibacillus sp. MSP4-1]QHS22412.1 hypothetical protein GWK91_05345 [Virgibacillus sp. MSP4-1]
MKEFLIAVNVSLLLLIASISTKKTLNILENSFLYLVLVFFVTGYTAVYYINLKLWSVADDPQLFLILRLYEVVMIPVLCLWYFNLLEVCKSWGSKGVLTTFMTGILGMVQLVMTNWGVIQYKNWQFWQSIVTFLVLLLVVRMLHVWFQSKLLKEGIK